MKKTGPSQIRTKDLCVPGVLVTNGPKGPGQLEMMPYNTCPVNKVIAIPLLIVKVTIYLNFGSQNILSGAIPTVKKLRKNNFVAIKIKKMSRNIAKQETLLVFHGDITLNNFLPWQSVSLWPE